MTDDWTCGKGLAAHSPLPKAIGVMLAAMAEMLDVHTRALVLTDPHGRTEFAAYASLIAQQRIIADSLSSMAAEMAAYESLPMAPHDMDMMTSPQFTTAFHSLLASEKALLELLVSTVDDLKQMSG